MTAEPQEIDDYEPDDDWLDEEEDEWCGDECGRWTNGKLGRWCSMAGTEFCDFECPYRDAAEEAGR